MSLCVCVFISVGVIELVCVYVIVSVYVSLCVCVCEVRQSITEKVGGESLTGDTHVCVCVTGDTHRGLKELLQRQGLNPTFVATVINS